MARRFGARFWVAGPGFESGSRSVAGAWVRGACAVQQASERAREREREQGFSLLSRRGCFPLPRVGRHLGVCSVRALAGVGV